MAALNGATIYLHALERGYAVLTRNIRGFDLMNHILPAGKVLFYRTAYQALAQAFVNQQAFQSALARPAFRLLPVADSIDAVPPWADTRRGSRNAFFFEKKNQKTSTYWRTPAGQARDSHPKVFCFFFSKKKFFYLLTVA